MTITGAVLQDAICKTTDAVVGWTSTIVGISTNTSCGTMPIPQQALSVTSWSAMMSVPECVMIIGTVCWLLVEFVFWLYVYRRVWIPRANQIELTPPRAFPQPYAAVDQRHELLLRILDRVVQMGQWAKQQQHQQQAMDQPEVGESRDVMRVAMTRFLIRYFRNHPALPDCNHHYHRNEIQQRLQALIVPIASGSSCRPSHIVPVIGMSDGIQENKIASEGSSNAKQHQASLESSESRRHAPQLKHISTMSSTESSSSSSSDDSSMASTDGEESELGPIMTSRCSDSDPVVSVDVQDADNRHPNTRPEHLWTIRGIGLEDTNALLAWALFGKRLIDLTAAERNEMDHCYQLIRDRYGLVFASGTLYQLQPRSMTLEPIQAMHRPLAVYVAVWIIKDILVAFILRFMFGFQRAVSPSTGLVAWYRLSQQQQQRKQYHPPMESSNITRAPTCATTRMPLLFFHGIAPGGLFLYLPMVLFGLIPRSRRYRCVDGEQNLNDNRSIFLFENPNISCWWGQFHALSEAETVLGVHEIVDTVGLTESERTLGVVLMGHSFGSCPMTWLWMHQKQQQQQQQLKGSDNDKTDCGNSLSTNSIQIRQMVLLDPVTILLSEPDVITNFLYSQERQMQFSSRAAVGAIETSCSQTIRMVASSELLTQYYLRRHFAWYQSELWLTDLSNPTLSGEQKDEPNGVAVLIALSEHDEIVPAPVVYGHVIHHMQALQQRQQSSIPSRSSSHLWQCLYWRQAGHAACVTSPRKWQDIYDVMWQQEKAIVAATAAAATINL